MQHATIAETLALPDWATLKTVSEETSNLVSLRDFEDLQLLLDNSNSRGLILYDSPVTTVALLLENGISAPEALTQWCAGAEMILGVLRSNRRNLVLAERPGGDETLQSLSAFFPKITPADLAKKETVANPITVQMAEMLLTLNRSAFKIWSELQASSVGHLSADIDPLQSIGGLAKEWHDLHQSHSVLLRYREEIGNALQQQVLQLEDSLKATENARVLAVTSNETQASRISELLTRLQTAASRQSEIGEELLTAQKERDAQANRLEQLQSELRASKGKFEVLSEKLDSEVKRTKRSEQSLARSRDIEAHLVAQVRDLEAGFKAKIDDREHHIQDLRCQLDAVYASNSWRITAPIRAVVMWWRGRD
ncbi:MAG: hypothetical protein MK208_15200 [Shimia sp.]|jgi:hypothetical protein|uniref:hypothetical protein n=1 Tax=Shimia sp. TaxID=1954381 RepID=UPI0025F18DB7|nr:hypothetical protein [Shimia sp.]MCH2068581.1 hypothetical protein [Shimia sp.]